MLFALAAVAWAGGTEVESRRVQGLTDAFVEVQLIAGRPTLLVGDGITSFGCHGMFTVNYAKKTLAKFADSASEATAALSAGQRLVFDPAVKGIIGTGAVSFCNLTASLEPTSDGTLLEALTFSYNRACFGDAGCNVDRVAVVVDAAKAAEVVAALRWGAGL